MEIIFYNHEIDYFLQELEVSTLAKTLRVIDLLERFGNNLGMPHSKILGRKLFELRIHADQEVRIFYTFHDQKAVLLHGFIKKSQKTPKKELLNALSKMKYLT